jgi:hypothetical protein
MTVESVLKPRSASGHTSRGRVKNPMSFDGGLFDWLRLRAIRNKRSISFELEYLLWDKYIEETNGKQE